MASIINVDKVRATGSTTDGLVVDSSGRVQMPQVPAFSVKLTSNWTTSNATVEYDTKIFDQGDNYSTSTGLFTAPVAGVYFFTTHGARYYNDPTGDYYLYLLKNGSIQIGFLNTHVTGYFTNTGGSLALDLAASDTVGIRWQAAGGGNKILYGAGDNAASFSGFLVG